MRSSSQRDRFLADEMLRHLEVIEAGARAGKTQLGSDDTIRYAVEHAMELLAEAAEKAGRPFKSANPGVPWDRLRPLRHDVAHPYDVGAERINVEELWRFAKSDAPRIARRLRGAKFPSTESPTRGE